MTTSIVLGVRRPSWPFLTARWTHLLLANYAVPAELLRPRLPPGLELDVRDGQAFASLVCFDFLDTRVFGIPWPGFRNFSEMNLRFYVRHGDERGVVFVREFVPQRFVAWLARVLYNEPYMAAPMSRSVVDEPGRVCVEHRVTFGGRTHTMRAIGDKPAYVPASGSVETFFKEHHWGFGKTRSGRTRRYHVWHAVWEVHAVRDVHIDLDWGALYGPEWSVMNESHPVSTVLAIGSPVAVYPHRALPRVPRVPTVQVRSGVADPESSLTPANIPNDSA
jgi:uncharacterized protein YqjF (DUF2071 family)